jgi:hypothetical protein
MPNFKLRHYRATRALASFYKGRTVGEVMRLMRCSRGCGGRVLAAWPALNQRVRPRRVPLLGAARLGYDKQDRGGSCGKSIAVSEYAMVRLPRYS